MTQDTGTGNKHKIGSNPEWKADFPWHVPVCDGSDSEVAGYIVGVLCSLCRRHRT